MSYPPPRPPPMVPNMPPYMPPMSSMGHMMPPLTTPPPPTRPTFRSAATISSQPTVYSRVEQPVPQYKGPIITVFVGNISERVPEAIFKRILSTCGVVVNWKRVSTFGFCEYDGPTAGMRAVRILSETEIDGKKLVAKVDAKNKLLLDNYKEEELKSGTSQPDTEKEDDEKVLSLLNGILDEYRNEFGDYKKGGEYFSRILKNKAGVPEDIKMSKALQEANLEEEKRNLISSEIGKFRKKAEADEHRKEKEKDRKKRNDEKEREKDLEKDKDKEKEGNKEKDNTKTNNNSNRGDRSDKINESPRKEKDRDSKDKRKRSKSRSKERERERERENRERERENRERERERERREREREKEREREERDRERERERERDEKIIKNVRDIQREKEIEEEMRERKKAEKKAREKEAAYQERLHNWELRERRKMKEYEKLNLKESLKMEEREKEAKRLKEFVEDYDDERDDIKYYKGRELQRRLAERVREADLDAKDRKREQEELEELKDKIFSGEYENPSQEFERAKKERENLYKPQILIDVNLEAIQRKEREIEREKERELEKKRQKDRDRLIKEKHILEQASRELASVNAEPIDSDSADGTSTHHHHGSNSKTRNSISRQGSETRDSVSNNHFQDEGSIGSMSSSHGFSPVNNHNNVMPGTPPISAPLISLNLGVSAKKKKIEVTDVFNNDEDNDDASNPKKRKLVPLDYDENYASQNKSTLQSGGNVLEQPQKTESSATNNSSSGRSKKRDKSESTAATGGGGDTGASTKDENTAKLQEEKRRHIKNIIDRIPTQKTDLFNYKLDRNEIDNHLMEKKIRPWINKKIIEYIGEPEPTLVDFICSKVLAGSSPQSILDDVQMVLDEEAEVFVVKMWRLLIYEVDAKKIGLGK